MIWVGTTIVVGTAGKLMFRQTDGEASCGPYTGWNVTQVLKRMHLSQF